MSDRDELIRALRLLFAEGDVFEIRVLKATSAGFKFPHTESGYFDYEHIPQAAEAVCRLRSYAGAYVTLNPVAPELLARAFNRLGPAEQNATTSDDNILRRRWLPIDCDPKRATGISSTDEEHETALKFAQQIQQGLSMLGWPEPVMLDSGNGAQMLYRIDLPKDDDGTVQRVINAIAPASTDKVQVDHSVHNPARIWRLPGSMNRKGDSIPERPHRMAKIISAPEEPECVSMDLINKVLENAQKPEQTAAVNDGTGFNLDAWIAEHLPNLGASSSWKGGRKWVFPVCPFNPEHNNGSAVLIEEPSGAIAFRCLHDSCTGNDWRALRELYEPGCYDVHKEYPEVDLSGLIVHQAKEMPVIVPQPVEIITPPEPEIIRPWDTVTNSDVRAVLAGTILGDLCDYYASVTRPPLPLEGTILKAMVSVGCALSEKAPFPQNTCTGAGNLGNALGLGPLGARLRIDTAGGQVANVFAMTVGNSSSGKDISDLLGKVANMYNWSLGTGGSAEGILDALVDIPNGLQTIAELKNWLDEKHYLNKAADMFTEMFSRGYFKYNMSKRNGKELFRQSDYAYPNVYANVQPDVLVKKSKMTDITSGFLGRFLMTLMPTFYGRPIRVNTVEMLSKMRICLDMFKRKAGVVDVPDYYLDDTSNMFELLSPKQIAPTWRRLVNEYSPRFAVMLSITHEPATQTSTVVLDDRCWKGAETLVLWFFANAEKLLINVNDFNERARERERLILKIIKVIKRKTQTGATWGDISNNAGYGTTKAERAQALEEMVDRSWIRQEGTQNICENGRTLLVGKRYFIGVLPKHIDAWD